MSPLLESHKFPPIKTCDNPKERLAALLGVFASEIRPLDAPLADLLDRWPNLPPDVRNTIMSHLRKDAL